MIAVYSEWLAERALLRLASAQTFEGVKPQTITLTLEQFAKVRSERSGLRISEKRLSTYKRILTHIWELANDRYLKSTLNRDAWLQVMASCNALYQPYEHNLRRGEVQALAA